jgi:hypothetical protein
MQPPAKAGCVLPYGSSGSKEDGNEGDNDRHVKKSPQHVND